MSARRSWALFIVLLISASSCRFSNHISDTTPRMEARLATSRPSLEPIRFRSASDAIVARKRLWEVVFGSKHAPTLEMAEVPADCPTWAPSCSAAVRLHGVMDGFLETNVIMYRPQVQRYPTLSLLYHHGHGGDHSDGRAVIQSFLKRGVRVYEFHMPLHGANPPAFYSSPSLGAFRITSHDQLVDLVQPSQGHPLRYFLLPVVALVDVLQAQGQTVVMTGISGGGWTTTLAAALHPGIRRSVSIAGSIPFPGRMSKRNWGDAEQHDGRIYNVVNYRELYLLAALDAGRFHAQHFNEKDPCCFRGEKDLVFFDDTLKRQRALGAGVLAFRQFPLDRHGADPDTIRGLLD